MSQSLPSGLVGNVISAALRGQSIPLQVAEESGLSPGEFTAEVQKITTSLQGHASHELAKRHGIDASEFREWAEGRHREEFLSAARERFRTRSTKAYDSLVSRYMKATVADPASRGYETRVNREGRTEVKIPDPLGWTTLTSAKFAGYL